MNYPPFYIGQKVVAIKNHSQGLFKRDDDFVIRGLRKSGCCNIWLVDIGRKTSCGIIKCNGCGFAERSEIGWYAAKLFAPIESKFESISFEKVIELESPLIGVN